MSNRGFGFISVPDIGCSVPLESVGDGFLAFSVRLIYSPSGALRSQYRVVLGRVSSAMGMHPS